MLKNISLIIIALVTIPILAAEDTLSTTLVSGNVYIGTAIHTGSTTEDTKLTYETNDLRLGTNSGNQYTSVADNRMSDVQLLYGITLQMKMREKHLLGITFEGKQDWQSTSATRSEALTDPNGILLSKLSGPYNHPQDRMNKLCAGAFYTYTLPRPQESLTIGYRYLRDYTSSGLEQLLSERIGWSPYNANLLSQQITCQTHHAYLDYVCPIVQGHALDMGIVYDHRQMDGHTTQMWDDQLLLNTDYSHLIRYGALYLRYRLALGPVKASAGLEYRATLIQQRWMHDAIPSASLSWQIDSIHSLTARYAMIIIRPQYSQLDTTIIRDAYSQSFGNDQLIGVHVHNTLLTYRMALPKIVFATELHYATANDGMNAIWMERGSMRIYTWGNEGIRHAVGLTPSIESKLGQGTHIQWAGTILWDERIAKPIGMSNANWGFSTKAQIEQQLPYAMSIDVHGEYAYHNTLDLYSYSGHGGEVGIRWNIAFLTQNKLTFRIGYTCRFIPDVHITQGAYTGVVAYHTGCTHHPEIHLGYTF